MTTLPGTRYDAFHAPGEVDPQVVETDEATKDVFSYTEIPDGLTLAILTPYSSEIDVPVLIANGQQDPFFCSVPTSDCSSRAALLAQERPYYRSAPCLDAVLMPGVGHDATLHPSAPEYQAKVLTWADAVTDGDCPDGP